MPTSYLLNAWVALASLLLCIGCDYVYADGTPTPKPLPLEKSRSTRIDVTNKAGTRFVANVSRDAFAAPTSNSLKVELFSEPSADSMIVIDSARSRSGGMSMCRAGIEKTLRVLERVKGRVQERERVKLESCHENIELAENGVEWNAVDSTLRIRWLQGPTNKGLAEQREMKISPLFR